MSLTQRQKVKETQKRQNQTDTQGKQENAAINKPVLQIYCYSVAITKENYTV